MYMIDTCVLVDFLKGRLSNGYRILQQSDPKMFKVPSIVEAELLLGAAKSKHPVKTRFEVERILAPFEIAPFDSRAALQYSKLRATLEANGSLIGLNDLIVAATALAYGVTLVTNNVKEFKRVPDLTVECWEEAKF